MLTVREDQDGECIDPRRLALPSTHVSPPRNKRVRSRSDSSSKSEHVRRPPNAYILYRMSKGKDPNIADVEHDQRNVSRIVGKLWNELPEEQKKYYHQAAEVKKLEHELQHPDYKFQPVPVTQPRKRRKRVDVDDEVARSREVAQKLQASNLDYQPSYMPAQADHEGDDRGYPEHATAGIPARTSHSEYPLASYHPSASSHYASASHYPTSTTNYSSTSHYPTSTTNYSSASHYPTSTTNYRSASNYPSSSSSSSSSYAFQPAHPHHSDSYGYAEHHSELYEYTDHHSDLYGYADHHSDLQRARY